MHKPGEEKTTENKTNETTLCRSSRRLVRLAQSTGLTNRIQGFSSTTGVLASYLQFLRGTD